MNKQEFLSNVYYWRDRLTIINYDIGEFVDGWKKFVRWLQDVKADNNLYSDVDKKIVQDILQVMDEYRGGPAVMSEAFEIITDIVRPLAKEIMQDNVQSVDETKKKNISFGFNLGDKKTVETQKAEPVKNNDKFSGFYLGDKTEKDSVKQVKTYRDGTRLISESNKKQDKSRELSPDTQDRWYGLFNGRK